VPEPKHKQKKGPSPTAPAATMSSEDALAAVKGDMEAVDEGTFVTINVDIPQAVSQTLGLVPHLAPFRAQIVQSLPDHPIRTFDLLQTYALAAYHAHILSMPGEGTESRVAAILAEAGPLRANLLSDAQALAQRKLLDADTVDQIRADRGNVDTANDLVALSSLLKANWSKIEGKTAATLDDIKRAGELGPLLLAALGVREHGVQMAPDALADQKRRAYTLFFRAYDETRRAIAYLRWHEGDADVIIPSLYKGRGGRPKASAEGGASAEASAEPSDPKKPG
jgi:hypothetical protein